jgi:hypothetical protein
MTFDHELISGDVNQSRIAVVYNRRCIPFYGSYMVVI